MSTPDTPETPALTRRQLRELRQTGATPIITPQMQAADAAAASDEPEAPAVIEAVPEAPARETTEIAADAPAQDALAKPVERDGLPGAQNAPDKPVERDGLPGAQNAPDKPVERDGLPAASAATPEPRGAFGSFPDGGVELGVSGLTRRQAREQEKIRTASVPIISPDLEPASSLVGSASPAFDAPQPAIFRPAAPETPTAPESPTEPGENETPSVVNPALGAELLGGASPDAALPASFDQLLARSTGATGTVSTPNSLILSQTPTGVPLVGPVTATGEIMITGTFDLPEGLGSVGHAPGTTDGRDADAVLLDGELPAASSPTPIAASAAISTVKQPGEIIRPPAPEKGSKLLVALIITTGILALGVAVTLGLAFTTGVFR